MKFLKAIILSLILCLLSISIVFGEDIARIMNFDIKVVESNSVYYEFSFKLTFQNDSENSIIYPVHFEAVDKDGFVLESFIERFRLSPRIQQDLSFTKMLNTRKVRQLDKWRVWGE